VLVKIPVAVLAVLDAWIATQPDHARAIRPLFAASPALRPPQSRSTKPLRIFGDPRRNFGPLEIVMPPKTYPPTARQALSAERADEPDRAFTAAPR
jgi:hypothetical protein